MAIRPKDFAAAITHLEHRIDTALSSVLEDGKTMYKIKSPDGLNPAAFEAIKELYIQAGWRNVTREKGTDTREMHSWDILIFEV